MINRIGVLLERQGRLEEAVERYREALRLNPQQQNALFNLAKILINRGGYAEGVASAQKLIAHNPDHARAHHMVGLGLFRLNRKAEALRHYDRALALDPNLTQAREQRKRFFESTTNAVQQ